MFSLLLGSIMSIERIALLCLLLIPCTQLPILAQGAPVADEFNVSTDDKNRTEEPKMAPSRAAEDIYQKLNVGIKTFVLPPDSEKVMSDRLPSAGGCSGQFRGAFSRVRAGCDIYRQYKSLRGGTNSEAARRLLGQATSEVNAGKSILDQAMNCVSRLPIRLGRRAPIIPAYEGPDPRGWKPGIRFSPYPNTTYMGQPVDPGLLSKLSPQDVANVRRGLPGLEQQAVQRAEQRQNLMANSPPAGGGRPAGGTSTGGRTASDAGGGGSTTGKFKDANGNDISVGPGQKVRMKDSFTGRPGTLENLGNGKFQFKEDIGNRPFITGKAGMTDLMRNMVPVEDVSTASGSPPTGTPTLQGTVGTDASPPPTMPPPVGGTNPRFPTTPMPGPTIPPTGLPSSLPIPGGLSGGSPVMPLGRPAASPGPLDALPSAPIQMGTGTGGSSAQPIQKTNEPPANPTAPGPIQASGGGDPLAPIAPVEMGTPSQHLQKNKPLTASTSENQTPDPVRPRGPAAPDKIPTTTKLQPENPLSDTPTGESPPNTPLFKPSAEKHGPPPPQTPQTPRSDTPTGESPSKPPLFKPGTEHNEPLPPKPRYKTVTIKPDWKRWHDGIVNALGDQWKRYTPTLPFPGVPGQFAEVVYRVTFNADGTVEVGENPRWRTGFDNLDRPTVEKMKSDIPGIILSLLPATTKLPEGTMYRNWSMDLRFTQKAIQGEQHKFSLRSSVTPDNSNYPNEPAHTIQVPIEPQGINY